MNKKTSLLVLIILLFSGFYFYLKEPTAIRTTKKKIQKRKKKIQNKFCFCSEEKDASLTACFDPEGKEFAVWNSKLNIALTPFKIPFTYGEWKKTEDKIVITFSDGKDFEILHN